MIGIDLRSNVVLILKKRASGIILYRLGRTCPGVLSPRPTLPLDSDRITMNINVELASCRILPQ